MEQQITAMWAQVGVGLLQCLLIAGGLWLMSRTGERRDRQLDIMEANQREQGQALREMGRAMTQALERQDQMLERQDQMLERQGQALERQGQALERQGQALEELLRRSA